MSLSMNIYEWLWIRTRVSLFLDAQSIEVCTYLLPKQGFSVLQHRNLLENVAIPDKSSAFLELQSPLFALMCAMPVITISGLAQLSSRQHFRLDRIATYGF